MGARRGEGAGGGERRRVREMTTSKTPMPEHDSSISLEHLDLALKSPNHRIGLAVRIIRNLLRQHEERIRRLEEMNSPQIETSQFPLLEVVRCSCGWVGHMPDLKVSGRDLSCPKCKETVLVDFRDTGEYHL